jgi:preprotein translocase subunit SecD
VKLVMTLVDDETDPLQQLPDRALPAGAAIWQEQVPCGIKHDGSRCHKTASYLRVKIRPDESATSAMMRGGEVVRGLPLPPGRHFAWELSEDVDPDTGIQSLTGVRSFVLVDEPFLDERHVAEAEPEVSTYDNQIYVMLTLTPEGASRFEEATGANVNRRIAIVLDGVINSAPVVLSKIGGGKASITMGAGAPDDQIARAKMLAAGLKAAARR